MKISLSTCHDVYRLLYDLHEHAPSIMPKTREHVSDVFELLDATPQAEIMLFEGFARNSVAEGCEEQERVACLARECGMHVLLSPGPVVDRWHDKRYFRDEIIALYGPDAVARGKGYTAPSTIRMMYFALSAFLQGQQRVIFKGNGFAGIGNYILDRGRDPLFTVIRHYGKVRCFIRKIYRAGANWISAEYWHPWTLSGACSYFVFDAQSPAVHMATIQQHVGATRGTYRGARSFLDLMDMDIQHLESLGNALARRMQDDGVRGFLGFDRILSDASGEDGELRLPDSGLAFRFIEGTARIAGHNHELRSISLIAQSDGCTSNDLMHSCLRSIPLHEASGEQGAKAYIAEVLGGVAILFSAQKIEAGQAYFILIYNHQGRSARGGSIMSFGYRHPGTRHKIELAEQLLSAHGLLKG